MVKPWVGPESVAILLSLPGLEASGADTDARELSLVPFAVMERRVWVSCEPEVVEGDVAFTPDMLVMLGVPGPPDHSEAKVLAAGMLGMPLVSEEVLRVWTLPAIPPPDGDGRAGGAVVLVTLPAPVAAELSVMDKGTAELGSVPPVVSGVAVVKEEVTLCTESVLDPDTLSVGAEAGDCGGVPVPLVVCPAELVPGEERARLVSRGVGSWLLAPQDRGAPGGEVSSREEETALDNGLMFPGAGASVVVVSDDVEGVGTLVWDTVQSVFVSVEAGTAVGRCFVPQLLSALLSVFAGISLGELYSLGA